MKRPKMRCRKQEKNRMDMYQIGKDVADLQSGMSSLEEQVAKINQENKPEMGFVGKDK